MKKLILIALVCSALYSSASDYFGVKPVINEPTCNGQNNGSISLSVLGGTAPYTYAWSGGLPATNPVNNVLAGSYTVTVTDANGLVANYTVVLGEPYALTVTTGSVNVVLHGGNNGSASVNVSGGTPSYTYEWSNGGSTSTINNLSSGVYTVTVTDAVGCTSTASQTVTQPAHAVFFNGIVPNNSNNAKILNTTGNSDSGNDSKPSSSLKSEDVQAYPVPASNILTLRTGDVNNAQITLFDINGQKISEQIAESTETNLNVSSLPAGNYVVEIKSADGSVVNKKITIAK